MSEQAKRLLQSERQRALSKLLDEKRVEEDEYRKEVANLKEILHQQTKDMGWQGAEIVNLKKKQAELAKRHGIEVGNLKKSFGVKARGLEAELKRLKKLTS